MSQQQPRRSVVRLSIHPSVEFPDRSPFSLSLYTVTRGLPDVRWMMHGDIAIPAPLPTEREAWEAILAVAEWHGGISSY